MFLHLEDSDLIVLEVVSVDLGSWYLVRLHLREDSRDASGQTDHN